MSGSIPECSTANILLARPIPIWIASDTNWLLQQMQESSVEEQLAAKNFVARDALRFS